MDAVAYQMSFDKEQLALLCANYDRRIDSLGAENKKLKAENAKLRELLTFYLGCLTKGHVNCDSCAFAEDICGHGHKVIDWARELGVEVSQ